MSFNLFDGPFRNHLLPFTFCRPVGELFVGMLSIKEKWTLYLSQKGGYVTENYLNALFPTQPEARLNIHAAVLPNPDLASAVLALREGERLMANETLVAYVGLDSSKCKEISYEKEINLLKHPWDIFRLNGQALREDFELLTKDSISQPISKTNNVIAPENIFIEAGAVVEFATLNASEGPIYFGKDALIMEGALIRGGFAAGEKSVVKMGTKIYGSTSIGVQCKVGGELNNVVMFSNSNKGHDGFLGNAVVGSWCNIGAATDASNLKNTYEPVRAWSYPEGRFIDTGLQFCGLMLGDYSKLGIHSMLNTGTVIGISANVFGDGFPRTYIPSFSWGGASGLVPFKFDKVISSIKAMKIRRALELSEAEISMLSHLYNEALK